MRLDEVFELTEARGSGSFDYRYWFWAKKGSSTYGIGYARQDVQVDIQKAGKDAADAAENINDVLSALESDETENLEVVEKKVKANTKRLKGIIDLFHSPIVVYWLNNDPPKVVEIPRTAESDVTDLNGRRIDVVDLFTDAKTSEFITHIMDWDKVNIDETKDTLNTVTARFVRMLFADDSSKKKVRALARDKGLDIMKDLSFTTDKGVELKSFEDSDYDLLPSDLIGSKKIVKEIKSIIESNFQDILKTVRKRLG